METGQDIEIRKSEDAILAFTVPGQAAIQVARWFTAPQRESLPDEHVLDLDTEDEGGVTLSADGDDLIVEVTLTNEQTEAFPVGELHHELWLEDVQGRRIPVAEGRIAVLDSLRN